MVAGQFPTENIWYHRCCRTLKFSKWPFPFESYRTHKQHIYALVCQKLTCIIYSHKYTQWLSLSLSLIQMYTDHFAKAKKQKQAQTQALHSESSKMVACAIQCEWTLNMKRILLFNVVTLHPHERVISKPFQLLSICNTILSLHSHLHALRLTTGPNIWMVMLISR